MFRHIMKKLNWLFLEYACLLDQRLSSQRIQRKNSRKKLVELIKVSSTRMISRISRIRLSRPLVGEQFKLLQAGPIKMDFGGEQRVRLP